MNSHLITLRTAVLSFFLLSLPTSAVQVELKKDVDETMSAEDSLNDVFPEVNVHFLPETRLTACLVDGTPAKGGNSVVLDHSKGPVYFTWDLGSDKGQLDGVALWLVGIDCKKMDHFRNHPPCFIGQLSTSTDGKQFTAIPGSHAEMIAPDTKQFNLVRWTFKPGEVKGFRYLRVESFGYKGQTCRIAEIDGWISGIKIPKSTQIKTEISLLRNDQITFKFPAISETQTAPMVVHPIRFQGTRLVRAADGKTLLNLEKLLDVPDGRWKITAKEIGNRNIFFAMTRDDGLTQTRNLHIDDENRAVLISEVELPKTAAKPVPFTRAVLNFAEGDFRYDRITYGSGSGPTYLGREKPSSIEIGAYSPYVIFPCKAANLELQFFMPDWYGTMGRIKAFADHSLLSWEFFIAAKNTYAETQDPKLKLDPSRWNEMEGQIQPGQKFSYKIQMGVFDITPPTLGQKDIETRPCNESLNWIDQGVAGQGVPGSPTVLFRDKMKFMGFKLREPAKEKIGHSVVDLGVIINDPKQLDRLDRAGVGLVVLMGDEFCDVSHGVSVWADYNKVPTYLPDLLKNLKKRNIIPVYWFSPRGFLNKEWLNRPKDPLVDLHKDWFLPTAHWYGNYQTVDIFKDPPNRWIIEKIKKDLTAFPELKGYAFDGLGATGTRIGGEKNITLTQCEQGWVKEFSNTIHSFGPDHLSMENGCTPIYDDYAYLDYTVSENPLLMFLNEVTAGHVPFGRSYAAYLQWGHLYGWYVTLAQMFYNFCDYDQGLGWFHICWLGWKEEQIGNALKPVDKEVIPLWYVMGKGRRIYAAQIASDVRQIEVKMPDGSMAVVLASMSPSTCDVQIVPQTIAKGKYSVGITVDTCLSHRDFPAIETDLIQTPAFQVNQVPPFSITLVRFQPK